MPVASMVCLTSFGIGRSVIFNGYVVAFWVRRVLA